MVVCPPFSGSPSSQSKFMCTNREVKTIEVLYKSYFMEAIMLCFKFISLYISSLNRLENSTYTDEGFISPTWSGNPHQCPHVNACTNLATQPNIDMSRIVGACVTFKNFLPTPEEKTLDSDGYVIDIEVNIICKFNPGTLL